MPGDADPVRRFDLCACPWPAPWPLRKPARVPTRPRPRRRSRAPPPSAEPVAITVAEPQASISAASSAVTTLAPRPRAGLPGGRARARSTGPAPCRCPRPARSRAPCAVTVAASGASTTESVARGHVAASGRAHEDPVARRSSSRTPSRASTWPPSRALTCVRSVATIVVHCRRPRAATASRIVTWAESAARTKPSPVTTNSPSPGADRDHVRARERVVELVLREDVERFHRMGPRCRPSAAELIWPPARSTAMMPTYLAEWIEFHRLIGVERFFLYDNGSADDHEQVLAPYVDEGIVVVHDCGRTRSSGTTAARGRSSPPSSTAAATCQRRALDRLPGRGRVPLLSHGRVPARGAAATTRSFPAWSSAGRSSAPPGMRRSRRGW